MSSNGSRPANSAASTGSGPATGAAFTVRLPLVVTIVIAMLVGAVPARASVTCPALQANDSSVAAGVAPNRATDRVPSRVQVQVPGVIAASRQSAAGAICGGGAGRTTGTGRVGSGAGSRGWHAASASRPSAAAGHRMKIARSEAFAIAAVLCDPARHLNPQERLPGSAREPTMINPPKPAKIRADQLVTERGLAESRSRAQALILAGLVFAGESKIAKAGQLLAAGTAIEVRGRDHPWVSRGGIKLAHALDHFGLDPAGATAMDIGSSTGGFTDVLLSLGAARVFAVDSGTNQLAWKLRQDPRVTVLEQTSARILTPAQIDAPCDWVVCDASFIGLAKVLEVPLRLAAPRATLVALIKPQFEVGRGEVGKGGVVRDPALHARVCGEVRDWLETVGWDVLGIAPSPITGPEGNVEFLIAATR